MSRRVQLPSRIGALTFVLAAALLGSCAETVVAPATVQEVVVSGGGSALRLGQAGQLGVTLKAENGVTLPSVGVTWASSDVSVATVSATGQVTALKRGTATITASAQAASGTASVPVIGVLSVSLAPDTVHVIVTQSRSLTVTTVLDPGVTVTPTYRSLDTLVARVDGTGRVTATGTTGIARIEVTAEDKRDTAVVRVIPVPVASVTVTPETVSVPAGEAVQLVASVRDSVGGGLTGRSVSWVSSDTAIAVVTEAGLVAAKPYAGGLPRSVTVTAMCEGRAGTSVITVRPAIARVVMSADTLAVFVRQTRGLTATPQAGDGTPLPDRAVSWASSDTAIAQVSSDGQVTGRAIGAVAVTATADGQRGTSVVRVIPVPVARVSVTPATATVIAGASQQFVGATFDSVGGSLIGRTVTWRTSDTTLAVVSPTGLVATRAAGSVIVTASSEGQVGSAILTIEPVVATVELNPPAATLYSSASAAALSPSGAVSQQLTALLKAADGTVLTGRVVTWSSSDTTVAVISVTGLVTAVGPGIVTITATSEGKSSLASVTIPALALRVTPSSVLTAVGDTTRILTQLRDARDSVYSANIAVQISDSSVASFGGSGLITARNPGSTAIRVTAGGLVTTVPVDVGANYRGQSLLGRDFSQRNLSFADFRDAQLLASLFHLTNLTGARLERANLTGAALFGADLTGAQLDSAVLIDVRFSGATKWPAGFNPAGRGMWGPGLDYSGLNLSNRDFFNYDFTGANFAGANLGSAKLTITAMIGANLTNVNLTAATLFGTDFTGAQLAGVLFTDAVFSRATKWPSGFTPAGKGMWGPNLDYSDRDLSNRSFFNYDFSGAKLQRTNLSGASLVIVGFEDADLTDANLSNAALDGANFSRATLTGAILTGAFYSASTVWPVGFNPVAAGAIRR